MWPNSDFFFVLDCSYSSLYVTWAHIYNKHVAVQPKITLAWQSILNMNIIVMRAFISWVISCGNRSVLRDCQVSGWGKAGKNSGSIHFSIHQICHFPVISAILPMLALSIAADNWWIMMRQWCEHAKGKNYTAITSAGKRKISDLGPDVQVAQIRIEKTRCHVICAVHTVGCDKTDLSQTFASSVTTASNTGAIICANDL